MTQRHISERILGSLADTPVVLINGARQTGKSTLAQLLAAGPHPAVYFTLDEVGVFEAANRDAAGFLAGLQGPVVIDEVQLAPDLFRAIKLEVDRDRRPGRFLLAGSADVLLVSRLSESLAGRMEVHRLWPFSQGELEGRREGLVDALFSDSLPPFEAGSLERADLLRRVVTGGYPEVGARGTGDRRRAWFGAYVATILQRDIRALADINGYTQLPRLLALLATQAGSLMNIANLSRETGIAHTTLKRYLTLIEATFLIHLLPAWVTDVRRRLIKTPKVLFNDAGLLSYLLDTNQQALGGTSPWIGPLIENFAGIELLKQLTWSATRANLFYYRTANGREVDYVLEAPGGRLVGVEVKASATVGGSDLKGLQDLSETAGSRFHRGVLLYTGRSVIPFGPRLHALPLSALWRLSTVPR
jgi:predicted AAA+ superfamily ATPase